MTNWLNDHPASLAGLCALMAACGLHQILRGWRQGEIMSRGGMVFREVDPRFFWFTMVLYGTVATVCAFVAVMTVLGR